MLKIKLADYVINTLADIGIDKVFVVYGAANGDLIDAFTRTQKIQYVAVMHEQAGGFAAEGYAKASGKIGAAIATSGPGGMNFVTPIGNCFYDSVPAIFITGQINSKFIKSDPDLRQVGFQETDIVSIVKPVTKYAKLITNPQTIRYELEKALFLAKSGRPGPVLLDIPMDIQKVIIEPKKQNGFDTSSEAIIFDEVSIKNQVNLILDDILKAKRPVMLIGGGVKIAHAINVMQRVSRLLQIPTFPTWNALDAVTSDLETYCGRVGTYGGAGRNFAIQNSDLLLAVGSRISGRITGGNVNTFARAAKKIMVDVIGAHLQPQLQQVPFDLNVKSDALLFFRLMEEEAIKRSYSSIRPECHQKWLTMARTWLVKYDPVHPELGDLKTEINPYRFMRQLSSKMDKNDILVADCGGNIVIASQAFETKLGQHFITNNGNSPMGFSFNGAMGAWFASPEKRVVCIIGDGGFNVNIQEIQTLINYGCKVKTFILNNHIYGITKAFQETNFNGRNEACGPKGYIPPNFIDICAAYKMKAIALKYPDEVERVIDDVFKFDGPVVCDVDIHEHHTYEPRIFGFAAPIEDMYPYIDRKEFRENMIIEPVQGWENPPLPNIEKSIGSIE
jgi:acetolactate synthase-1/2/3 large subunit